LEYANFREKSLLDTLFNALVVELLDADALVPDPVEDAVAPSGHAALFTKKIG
jgi:hypothetical protein